MRYEILRSALSGLVVTAAGFTGGGGNPMVFQVIDGGCGEGGRWLRGVIGWGGGFLVSCCCGGDEGKSGCVEWVGEGI